MTQPYHGRGAFRTVTLAKEDPGAIADAAAFIFEIASRGCFPREQTLYIVPTGRSVIVQVQWLGKGTLGMTQIPQLRSILLEIGDPICGGKYMVVDPLPLTRITLTKMFPYFDLPDEPNASWKREPSSK